MIKTPINFYKT